MYSLGTDPPTVLSSKRKPSPARQRLQPECHDAELATAAALSNKARFMLNGAGDGLTVGDLRLADVCPYAELTQHTVDQHFEMQFAHALY